MAPVLSKLRPERAVLGITSVGVLYWLAKQCAGGSTKRRTQQAENDVTFISGQKPEKKERVQVDMVFLGRLLRIFKIMVPGWLTAEAGYMGLILVCLFLRTYCDVWMIHNGTSIERSIIGDDKRQFKLHLGAFMTAMPLISVVNSVLKYSLNELKLRLRTKLTSHLYTQYLSEFTYYKMSNLDNRIANADQLLTQDVEKFCDSFTEWYSNISKPVLDIIVYIYKLSSSLGPTGPLSLIGYMVFAGTFLNRIRRPIARHTVTEQRLEGEFRFVNSRLIISSEEIAFYRGSKREKATIDLSFKQLVNHLRRFIHFKFLMGFMESIVGKYAATVVGYLVVSRPFLNPKHNLASASHNDRLEDYYRSGRMLIKLAEAIGRVVLAGREMTRLAGFTARVTELMNVLKDLQNGKYVRTMINQNGKSVGLLNGGVTPKRDLVPGRGKIVHRDNIIRFDKVPLVTPNGDVLIDELNFEVHSGMNVLVCGPNGCGKSSLFRTLGELWPLFGGMLTKPDPGKLFYIPQKPYMTLGTLRDQVLYPDGQEEQRKKGATDSDLLRYLDLVQLNYLLDREGGWDAVQDWMDVLSGGEKQRIAMARLFYHKPQFAILDECTSAVSVDVEGSMYQYCREVGITLFTVSHRKSLWKHHEYFLHMDGRGSYEFKEIADDTEEFGS